MVAGASDAGSFPAFYCTITMGESSNKTASSFGVYNRNRANWSWLMMKDDDGEVIQFMKFAQGRHKRKLKPFPPLRPVI
jgi:hypothetical protein